MFALLRQRNFGLVWFGQFISSIGDWLLWIALPFYIYERTGSALSTGAVFVIQTLPSILFGTTAGVLVDRWNRKTILIVSDVLRALVILGLLAAYSPEWLWLCYPIAFVENLIVQFFNPAKNAFIPSLVNQDNLLSANALNALSDQFASVAGPALGGILFIILGLNGIVLLDSVTFLVSAVMISRVVSCSTSTLALEKPFQVPDAGLKQQWITGIRLLTLEPRLLALTTIVGVAMLGQGIISVLWVVFVRENLKSGSDLYGLIQVAVACGGILGTLIIGQLKLPKRLSPERLIALSGLGTGTLLLATYNIPGLVAIFVFQIGVGIAAVGFFVTIQTALQVVADERYLGRVFGIYYTLTALAMLVGQGIGGLLGDKLGIVPMLNISGCLYFLSGIVAMVVLPNGTNLAQSVEM